MFPLHGQLLHWERPGLAELCRGVTSMTGRHQGVVRQILDRAPEAKWTHCFLHRESLAAKKMSPEFHEVVTVSVKTINFIKNNAVNSRFCPVLWGHRNRSCLAALSQWSEMALKRTGPQAFVWTEEWGLHFSHWEKISLCTLLCKHRVYSKTCQPLWHFFTPEPAEHLSSRKKQQTKFKLSRGNLLCGPRGHRKRRWTCFHFCLTFWKTPLRWTLVTQSLSIVCSFHFVDKKPTEEHPHPTLWLGYERLLEKRHRVLKRTDSSVTRITGMISCVWRTQHCSICQATTCITIFWTVQM